MNAVLVPVKVVSALNQREHWSARKRRAEGHRKATYWALMSTLGSGRVGIQAWPRISVSFTRVYRGQGKEMDGDNLQGSIKHVRDGLCDWLGIDDASDRFVWAYHQRRGNVTGIEILLEMA